MAPAIPRRPRPEWQPEGEYLFPPPTRPAPAPAARAPISPPPARARRRAAAPIRPPDPRSPDASLTPRRPPRSCGAPRRPLPRARGARRRHSAKQDPPTIPSCARFPPFRWSRAWSPGAGDAKSVLDGRGDQSVHDGQNLQGTVEKRWDRMGRLPQVARQNRRKNWVGLSPLTLGEGPGGTLHPQPLTLGFGLPKPGATFSSPPAELPSSRLSVCPPLGSGRTGFIRFQPTGFTCTGTAAPGRRLSACCRTSRSRPSRGRSPVGQSVFASFTGGRWVCFASHCRLHAAQQNAPERRKDASTRH
ncbi:hypothetical protein SAMN00790413_04201 [Deinococcus hopiensis KR-140]|uniref:Uncharacterized protein n=1 Tax=Deinococcus hopiensis KR-140 TaxID=695939 RepID=A0A1W1UPC4_9DEIO|nr:hypothetical protein SAMN00790413_04201 [Deinococcus hopiensis KR-140]